MKFTHNIEVQQQSYVTSKYYIMNLHPSLSESPSSDDDSSSASSSRSSTSIQSSSSSSLNSSFASEELSRPNTHIPTNPPMIQQNNNQNKFNKDQEQSHDEKTENTSLSSSLSSLSLKKKSLPSSSSLSLPLLSGEFDDGEVVLFKQSVSLRTKVCNEESNDCTVYENSSYYSDSLTISTELSLFDNEEENGNNGEGDDGWDDLSEAEDYEEEEEEEKCDDSDNASKDNDFDDKSTCSLDSQSAHFSNSNPNSSPDYTNCFDYMNAIKSSSPLGMSCIFDDHSTLDQPGKGTERQTSMTSTETVLTDTSASTSQSHTSIERFVIRTPANRTVQFHQDIVTQIRIQPVIPSQDRPDVYFSMHEIQKCRDEEKDVYNTAAAVDALLADSYIAELKQRC